MKKVLKSGMFCQQCEVFLEHQQLREWECWCQTNYFDKAEIVMNVNTANRK